MIAEVIINSSVKKLNRTFDYEIPDELEIKIGSRVFIPFGRYITARIYLENMTTSVSLLLQ